MSSNSDTQNNTINHCAPASLEDTLLSKLEVLRRQQVVLHMYESKIKEAS